MIILKGKKKDFNHINLVIDLGYFFFLLLLETIFRKELDVCNKTKTILKQHTSVATECLF